MIHELARSIQFASTLSAKPRAPARVCDWPELDRILPDGGLPHAVIEITSAHAAYAGATAVAVAAVRAAHVRDTRAWCAWIDGNDRAGTLFAPGLARAGIDLARLLVVRPPASMRARVTVKTASSGAFDVMIVEGCCDRNTGKLVRKLALVAEQHGTSILLLAPPHADPWPVALRLEVSRTAEGIDVRVTKDRFGRAPAHLAKTHVPIQIRTAS